MTHDPGRLFVHLRAHSAYSLSEGALTVSELTRLAADGGMPALALTDSNNLFGALEFSQTAIARGVQPITGCVLMVDFAPEAGKDPTRPSPPVSPASDEHMATLVLLAKDAEGYRNLMKLSSLSYRNSCDYGLVKVLHEALSRHGQGLICLTGGPQGPIDRAIANGQDALARDRLKSLAACFPDRLYVEIQRHGTETETRVEPALLALAYEEALPLVATQDVFFAAADDFSAHDALLCIADGQVIAAQDRRRLNTQYYFKTMAEMSEVFADLPEAIDNTVEIARRCAFAPQPRPPILPVFRTGNGETVDAEAHLRTLAEDGLEDRLKNGGTAPDKSEADYRQRLDYELGVIIDKDFAGYFLIVADFITHAKENGIPVGPGRGSGAGSLVAYALKITDLDPLRFGLLFERFLNPGRRSMPDFDIDFCQERRDEVIDYVQKRYGADRVAHIITFGSFQARAVCRDVGRVLQMPYGQVDKLCKLIPLNPANPVSLQQAIDGEPRLQAERDGDDTVRLMLETGLKLEGLYRHASTHAAGVVIADRPLDELVPLYYDSRSAMPATQFNLKWVEQAGLVKFDFLGLKTLTVIAMAEAMVRTHQPGFAIADAPFDDPKVYDMLGRGETVGLFQLESSGMRDVLRKIGADCIEDIIAIVALYRPGPMDNIPRFIACKNGQEQIDFLHEKIRPILAETYGIIVYQEQVMQIAQELSGYSLADADVLRRAMGKKNQKEMDQQKTRFVSGAKERGIDAARADHIFELVAKFAGYGFNKSHAACYAILAYQTSYLKANYPVEFMAASMTLDIGNTDKLLVFRQDAHRLGIELKPPAINASHEVFTVDGNGIRYGLAALRNVGRGAAEHIASVRRDGGPFASLNDFARRIGDHALNKRALESLIKAGAFDELDDNRARLLAGAEAIMAAAQRASSAAQSGQDDLFGTGEDMGGGLVLADCDPWRPAERLKHEAEAVGFYISGHPLDEYAATLAGLGFESWTGFCDKVRHHGASAARLAGVITQRQERRGRSGNPFAFISFSDQSGEFEAICFSDILDRYRDLLEPGMLAGLTVEAAADGDAVKLRLNAVESLDAALARSREGLHVTTDGSVAVEELKRHLRDGGRAPVHITLRLEDDSGDDMEVTLRLGQRFTVTPDLRTELAALPGVTAVNGLPPSTEA